jgi:predicted nucleotidyltransferase
MANIQDDILLWVLTASTAVVFLFVAVVLAGSYATGAARSRRDYDQGSLDE